MKCYHIFIVVLFKYAVNISEWNRSKDEEARRRKKLGERKHRL